MQTRIHTYIHTCTWKLTYICTHFKFFFFCFSHTQTYTCTFFSHTQHFTFFLLAPIQSLTSNLSLNDKRCDYSYKIYILEFCSPWTIRILVACIKNSLSPHIYTIIYSTFSYLYYTCIFSKHTQTRAYSYISSWISSSLVMEIVLDHASRVINLDHWLNEDVWLNKIVFVSNVHLFK